MALAWTHIEGFSPHQLQRGQNLAQTTYHEHLLPKTYTSSAVAPLPAKLDENNGQIDATDDAQDNFDGKGFANYLGPYAIALVASIAVTAGFVKYVLMDY